MVAFLSADYAKSEACMREWKVGFAKRRLLVVLVGSLEEIMAIDVSEHPAASAALAFVESGQSPVIIHSFFNLPACLSFQTYLVHVRVRVYAHHLILQIPHPPPPLEKNA